MQKKQTLTPHPTTWLRGDQHYVLLPTQNVQSYIFYLSTLFSPSIQRENITQNTTATNTSLAN